MDADLSDFSDFSDMCVLSKPTSLDCTRQYTTALLTPSRSTLGLSKNSHQIQCNALFDDTIRTQSSPSVPLLMPHLLPPSFSLSSGSTSTAFGSVSSGSSTLFPFTSPLFCSIMASAIDSTSTANSDSSLVHQNNHSDQTSTKDSSKDTPENTPKDTSKAMSNTTSTYVPRQAINSNASPWYHQMIAGAGAGATAAIFVSPLDVARMRIQVRRGPSISSDIFGFHLLKRMVQTEGPSSLFYGLGANILALVPNWVTYFIAYSQYRKHMEPLFNRTFGGYTSSSSSLKNGKSKNTDNVGDKEGLLRSTIFDISNALFAGFTTFVVTNPLWLVKARLQVQGIAVQDANLRQAEALKARAAGLGSDVLPGMVARSQLGISPLSVSVPGTVPGISAAADISTVAAMGPNGSSISSGNMLKPPPPALQQGVIYRGTFHALVTIYKTEGFRALYHGLVPQLFGLIHAGIHFPLYEGIKRSFLERNMQKARERFTYRQANASGVNIKPPAGTRMSSSGEEIVGLSTFQIIVASTISKLVACIAAYPHEVLRSRFQTQHHLAALSKGRGVGKLYSSLPDAIRTVYAEEGLRGFYRGLSVTLVRSIPACIVTFLTYEKIIHYLAKKDS